MCGIIAVLRRPPSESRFGDCEAHLERLERAVVELGRSVAPEAEAWLRVSSELAAVDAAFKTAEGVRALVADDSVGREIERLAESLEAFLRGREEALDRPGTELDAGLVERCNAALIELKDRAWALRCDRLGTARAVGALAAGCHHLAAIRGLLSIQQALSALERLEVRGRDSAGLHLLISGHGLDLSAAPVQGLVAERGDDPLYGSGSVRAHGGVLSIVYKVAAEIGELGDNPSALRRAIAADRLLHLALESPDVEIVVLGHTRWASVGLTSEANAHPLNEELSPPAQGWPPTRAVLNGDVDNYAELITAEGLSFAEEITTDAKVIPSMFASRLARGLGGEEAFRETVSSFIGSVAIAAQTLDDPERLYLALHGSGQALYVGLGEDCYIVASELYGVVEETACYLRLDGETPANPDSPIATRGQIVVLDRLHAGTLEGIKRVAYDGTELAVAAEELQRAEITTRDIDRGDFSHFLLKEIGEAPSSFLKTLRGRVVETADRELRVELGEEAISPTVLEALRTGLLRRIVVIGQGTAAVAGQGVARAIAEAFTARGLRWEVGAMPATELSGFHLTSDMSDLLVVAISQSGTTTDTNRTVDLVRARGAQVIAIVNRRHSDLTDKADGVLFTSDGRDVEMSVASTKAFYSQIAAGFLLAEWLVDVVAEHPPDRRRQVLLEALRRLPEAMSQVIAQGEEIARIARHHAPPKRYWALVGNGWNGIAAQEIRIKLSELCYKSIACDVTEDKKHIDLSSEPLILVCATGLVGSTAGDVAKEVAIYSAHKATPVVIASAGEQSFAAAAEVIRVPAVHPSLAFVLTALAGHLFGYHAALAIDLQARPLRQIRSAIERVAHEALTAAERVDVLPRLAAEIAPAADELLGELGEGRYDGHLEASTAVRLAVLLRQVEGSFSLDAYPFGESGVPRSPATVVEDLNAAVTRAIEELTRPIDAIKHQAKTVTVGISRTDESLLVVPLVQQLLATGVGRDRLSYADLRTLAALDPVVERVRGYSRYRITGDPAAEECSIEVTASGGISRRLPSRTADNPVLKGTKRRVALERSLLAARGESDGRVFVLVPELEDGHTTGLTLIHVDFVETASDSTLKGVLQAYRNRYSLLRDAVTETEPTLHENYHQRASVTELLLDPIRQLAERWRVDRTPRKDP